MILQQALKQSHEYKKNSSTSDTVVDATMGNGHDSFSCLINRQRKYMHLISKEGY